MAKPVTRRDVLWGYAASALNIGAGLILLPVILRYLSTEDVGLWFVFVALAGFAQILEFGFQPTLARNAAYVYSGKQSLIKEGLHPEVVKNQIVNLELLNNLVLAAKHIYKIVAAVALAVLCGGGGLYVSTLLTPVQNYKIYILAWLIFGVSYVINFYYGYINGLLQGRGEIVQASKVLVFSRCIQVILGATATIVGYGLLGLAVATFFSAVLGRILAYHYFTLNFKQLSTTLDSEQQGRLTRELVEVLWYNASRLGIVQIGAFLILRGNILIASSFLGLAAAASYSMTVTLLITLSGIAMVATQIQVPHMSALQARGERKALTSVYGLAVLVSLSTFLFGLIALLIFGEQILLSLGSKTGLLPSPVLIVLGLILLLEVNHSVAATFLTTTNNVPFTNASILSGFAIISLSFLTVQSFGIIGLVISQGVVQISYNNWRWPYLALKSVNCSLIDTLRLGLYELRKKN